MSALTTLEGLADGTDVAVQMGSNFERWQVSGDGLIRDGVHVSGFFFTGYLRQGRVYLRDFTPPQVGEWFGPSTGETRWSYLTVLADGETTTFAQFRDDTFYQWHRIGSSESVARYSRKPVPDWAGPGRALREMTMMAHNMHTNLERMERTARRQRDAARNVRVASDYLHRAQELMSDE